jgi:hypothetical protein
MKILFCLRSTVYARNFESTLRMLAEHGHDVHIVADRHWADSDDLVRRLCDGYPSIHYSEPPIVPFNAWSFFGSELRAGIDYLRYLGPEFEDAAKLRVRAERNAPAFVLSILKRPGMNTPRGRALLGRMFATLDRAVPHHPEIEKFVRSCAPDLVLVTPLVEPGSPQSEYVRAARALGIRTGLCVYSWDNLTNKGLIHEPLDVVTVWNDAMKHEAITLHGVPSERIEVTGAAAYDHWFEWQPRESRAEFCGRIGVSADRPYILYVCSSRFIAPQEVDFIRRWVTELRASSETLRNVGVLVRPHPQHFKPWKIKPLSDLERLTVWPGEGANPLDERSRAEYHDSIYHSAAVVGVNTSALIESAIVGRAVYTVLAPEFRDTQQGTLHFHHLVTSTAVSSMSRTRCRNTRRSSKRPSADPAMTHAAAASSRHLFARTAFGSRRRLALSPPSNARPHSVRSARAVGRGTDACCGRRLQERQRCWPVPMLPGPKKPPAAKPSNSVVRLRASHNDRKRSRQGIGVRRNRLSVIPRRSLLTCTT